MYDKHLVVTGAARSGTSCLMGAIREAGVPISGFEYPVRMQNQDRIIDGGLEVPTADHPNLDHPHPLWERTSLLAEGLRAPVNGYAVKVTTALVSSKPELVDKVILMIRHPQAICASQLKAVSNAKRMGNNAIFDEIGITWTTQLTWTLAYNKKLLIIDYDDLLEQPEETMSTVLDFIGRGDEQYGARYINKKSRHFEIGDPEELSEEYCFAYSIYQDIKEGNYQEVLKRDISKNMERVAKARQALTKGGKA